MTHDANPERRPRVAIVGPVAPYRGGIARYTASLSDALAEVADVTVWSFAKMYPERLYPGATDVDQGAERREDVHYTLHALNPLSWVRTGRLIAASRPDLVLINWWTVYWQPAWALITQILRRRGIRVVYLVHNLADHDAPGLQRRASHALLRGADGYVVHSAHQVEQLTTIKPGATVLRRPHPVYDYYPPVVEHLPRRGRLELLFFGFIRPYKGLDVLIDALRRLDDPSVSVSVVGESWDDVSELVERVRHLPVEFRLEYVTDSEAAAYLDRADAVVLPYRTATGSGIVASAYHHGTPVIATDVPGLIDVVDESTGWVVPVDDPEALADTIRTMTPEDCATRSAGTREFTRDNDWPAMARAVLRTFLGDRGPRQGRPRPA